MIRHPSVAGQFYPRDAAGLKAEIARLLPKKAPGRVKAIGAVLPHAGYFYSGHTACAVLSRIEPAHLYVIIGPNHTGLGPAFSVDTSSLWRTPFGNVPVDRDFAERLIARCKYLERDHDAHAREHSVEVQLPLLQTLSGDFSIVPIVASEADITAYQGIGHAIAETASEVDGRYVVIIASTDMTHYESDSSARAKDSLAIGEVLKLDEKALDSRVRSMAISMCGYVPTCIMLAAAKRRGATKGELVEYTTSGDASGDRSSVVGYAGIMIT